MRAAAGEILVFSDDDRIVDPEFVSAHARHFQENADVLVFGKQRGIVSLWRPDIRIQASSLWSLIARNPKLADTIGGTRTAQLFTAEELLDNFADVIQRFGVAEVWWDTHCTSFIDRHGEELKELWMPWIVGATSNMSVRKKRVIDVGGFDQGFHGWGLEDADLCYRLHHAGVRTLIDSAATNYHQVHPTGDPSTKMHDWTQNLVHFMNKHDRLDVSLYAFWMSNARYPNMIRLNEVCRELLSDDVRDTACARELKRIHAELVEDRVRAIDRSRVFHVPGAEWFD